MSGKQTVLTYSYLYEASNFALEQAMNSEEGSFYNCLCSIVMNAFCLEAYVNHVGMDHFPNWDEWASPLDKLERVTSEVGIQVHYGKRPFRSIKEVNKFRNSLAHGRTAVTPISYTEETDSRRKVKRQKTKWEKVCTEANAKRFLNDLEEVIRSIHQQYGFEWPAFGVLGHSHYVKQVK